MKIENDVSISVSDLNKLISESIRKAPPLRNVLVTAEVSGFKHHLASGHWYFSLKDEESSIGCVMFRQNTFHSALRPKDGDKVTVQGYVDFFSRDGRVQLYVVDMKPAGSGSLYERFEVLKRKLEQEGLFDPGRKKLIPLYPRKVAVITSASGAALHDILNVSRQRNPSVPIVLIPSGVQGADAAKELVSAIKKAVLVPDVDVIIIGRGGGSPEDLWCFNEELLARAIASCPVPVVSGVGHETDFTICDFVSDFRASTPSNAAEIVFPDRNELLERILALRVSLFRAVNEKILSNRLKVKEQRIQLQHLSPETVIHGLMDRTHQCKQIISQEMERLLRKKENELTQIRTRLIASVERICSEKTFEIRRFQAQLTALSPIKVLERGYALVYDDKEERILTNRKDALLQKEMRIRFKDGCLKVLKKEETE